MGAVDAAVVAYVDQRIAQVEERCARAIAEAQRLAGARVPSVQAPFGTVVAVAGNEAQVQLDADGEVISSIATATIIVGDRVAVLSVPPAGSLVLGKIG